MSIETFPPPATRGQAWLAVDHPPYGWEKIIAADPTLATIQKHIRSWQRTGANESAVPLVLSDIRRILAE